MIRVAVIGCGNISSQHIEAYLAFPERCKIVALVDIYPEKAQKRAEEFVPDAEIFDAHEALLGRDDIDLVSVCTPPYTHKEITVNFLKAGKNVILEKPMAASLEECDEIIKAQQESKQTLSVIAQNRFRTPIMKLKKTLDSGLIGDVVHAQVDSFWWRGHCYYDLWWRGTWEKEGGGCTLNHAVHHIDMLSWMMGLPQEITAVLGNTSHDNAEVEDLSVAILKYAGGALGQITSSVVHHGEKQQLIFQGKKARISAPWELYASRSKSNGFPEEDKEVEAEIQAYYDSLPEVPYTAHTGQIENVLTALENKTEPMIQGKDGKATLEIITAIYKAGSTGQPVKLPLAKDDPFYTTTGILAHAVHFYEKKTSIENFADEKISVGSDYKK
ncbi:putative dehydrogenase [Hydrogenispora ethanolica]|jgi:predicted dehydrogenase|uniref:Putative dehydrogenase n=1 Tax=Hydrogenispora ethanolica TaxID=1082276 RepID=A0A4R1S4T3_HYDET|nr:Gfo/Idh/MocA family oxidoreductase [Hydrogenispora ethanolica]TCL74295.1 putative dehydrogenase [Hydrogenispora ethanolica]